MSVEFVVADDGISSATESISVHENMDPYRTLEGGIDRVVGRKVILCDIGSSRGKREGSF